MIPEAQAIQRLGPIAFYMQERGNSFIRADEVMNLFARHNIPFKVFLPADLKGQDVEGFDVVVVFAKGDPAMVERINTLAAHGKTIVVVDARGASPWQTHESVRVNEHTVSYAVGTGKILVLSEPVTDPEALFDRPTIAELAVYFAGPGADGGVAALTVSEMAGKA